MMAWPGETEDQQQQQWQARFARERLGLSASIEEALADSSVQEDLLSTEQDDTEGVASGHRITVIIPPKLSLQTKPMSVVHMPSPEKTTDATKRAEPVGPSVEGSRKQRLAGRTTKVRLQAVTKIEKRERLAGSGVFEPGQGEVSIANSLVSSSSVVVVNLTGNPGPVVVQYIKLQPQVGFTVHLSAPAKAKTGFNYVMLMGELF